VLAAPTDAQGTPIAGAGDSANGGIFFFRNLSASGNVEVGRREGNPAVFKPFLLLKPGEYSLGRLAADLPETGGASILAVKGSTANVEVQFTIFDGT